MHDQHGLLMAMVYAYMYLYFMAVQTSQRIIIMHKSEAITTSQCC